MASFLVSGKKLEEAERKVHELEIKLAETQKENSLLKEQLEAVKAEKKELEEKVKSTLFSIDKKVIERKKDQIVGKAKGTIGGYIDSLTK